MFASFVAVAQGGSISAGARRQGVTQAAMTRQIQRLEHDLGVRLLVRGTGPLRTTLTGARLHDRQSSRQRSASATPAR
ncbi:LysR family transcriptional regulator [Streptomyces milbemycinicus]|uniref:LysR family transcriptional regulator n=1 Tax=Streptomyces milbemycinicus TaxID=476552 RepID=A0ABW8M030_9ACTN